MKRHLSIFTGILLLNQVWVSAQIDLNKGLVGYWNFDNIEGNTVADVLGKGNTGTIGPGISVVDGKFGKAVKFSVGSSRQDKARKVEIANYPELEIKGDITMSAWVRSDDPSYLCAIVQKGSYDYWLFMSSSHIGCPALGSRVWNPGEVMTKDSHKLKTGVWTHVIGVNRRSDGWGTMYINGVDAGYPIQQPNLTREKRVSGRSLNIGNEDEMGRHWPGTLDEIRIYNRVLSAAEAKALYEFAGGKTASVMPLTLRMSPPQVPERFSPVFCINGRQLSRADVMMMSRPTRAHRIIIQGSSGR